MAGATSRRGRRPCAVLVAAGALAGSVAAQAWDTVALAPERDNTLYETPEGTDELSNGAGDFLFAGRAGLDAGFRLRRALLRFDLSALPAGATIRHVELVLHQSKAAPGSPPAEMGLYRALQEWSEGSSDGIGAEGQGNLATAGDATWYHRVWPDLTWDTEGGSFAPSPSSSVTVGQALGPFTWPCTAALVADLQAWLDAPATNFGWVLAGGEEAGYSAHRFNSREHFTPAERPLLKVSYQPAGTILADGFEIQPGCAD
jgi:hypothetical protein